jgi:hypothetical protein
MGSATLAPTGQPAPMQPGDYTPAGQSAVVTWNMKRLTPPSPLYVTVDDVLHLSYSSSQTNELVTVNYRLLRAADGRVVMGSDTIDGPITRQLKTADIPLAEGFLLSVSCQASVATTRGQTFVRLMLNPKALGAGQPGLMLMSDYVTTQMAPGWPNGRTLSPQEGPGYEYTLFPFSFLGLATETAVVPNNARWRIKAVFFAGQTDATAGTRNAGMSIVSGGSVVWDNYCPAGQAPSTLIAYYGTPVQVRDTSLLTSGWIAIPPDLTLLAGDQVQVRLAGALGSDGLVGPGLRVEEWLDNV